MASPSIYSFGPTYKKDTFLYNINDDNNNNNNNNNNYNNPTTHDKNLHYALLKYYIYIYIYILFGFRSL